MLGACMLRVRLLRAGFLVAAVGLVPPPAGAVTINVSLSQFTDPPDDDMTGAKMLAIVNAAADYWEDIIEDPFVLDVEIGYQNNSGDLAFSCYATGSLDCIDGDVQSATPSFGLIRFDNSRPTGQEGTNPDGSVRWFFDSTPLNNSEFDMQQTLVRSLSPFNVDFFYSDTQPPGLMEAGMLGHANVPDDRFDAFTVALHELGHLLGTLNEISIPETMNDNAYDVNPLFVYGESVEIAIEPTDGEHLANSMALLRTTVSVDQRLLPSATDVFAIAAGAEVDWAFLDLRRQDFFGGTVWEVLGNWEGNSLPDEDDDAFVRSGSDVQVFSNHEVANLLVAEGSSIELNNDNTLTVGNKMTIGGQGGGTAVVSVLGDSAIVAGEVRVADDGRLLPSGSIFDVDVDANEVVIEAGGIVIGTGRIRADSISLSGTLTALAPVGSLTNVLALDAKPGGAIDLDGSGGGQIFAVLASVSVSGPTTDSFGGEITVGAGRSIFFDEPWVFGQFQIGGPGSGVLNLNGGASDTQEATLNAQGWTAQDGEINVTGRGVVLGATTFGPGVEVNVETGGFLRLQGETEYAGGDFMGGGTIVLNNDTTVTAPTTVNVSRFDLDGDDFGQTITLTAPLTLNVDYIDTGNNNVNFDTIDINFGGQLAVNLNSLNAWTMGSTLNINLGLFPQTVLDGDEINVTGTLNADGSSVVAAPLDVSGTLHFVDTQSQLTLSAPQFVRLNQHVIRSGATISGGGTLVIGNNALLVLEDGVTISGNLENDGELRLGNSPGEAMVGFYAQSTDATWNVEIAGTPVSGDFDQLEVVGQAHLAGLLDVSLIDNFVPDIGDEFTILTAGRVLDTFDDLIVSDDAGIVRVDMVAVYTATTVVLRVDDVGVLGDFNDDGIVNIGDYVVWRNNLGAPDESGIADNGDGGGVNASDYQLWRDNFGMSLSTLEVGGISSAVPEPKTRILLTLSLAMVIGLGRNCFPQ